MNKPLQLRLISGEFTVHRLDPMSDVPAAVWQSTFVSVSRSDDELSIITDAKISVDARNSVGPWLAYRVPGAMDFEMTGVMSALTIPLAEAGIAILAVSTYDTDFILVRTETGAAAESAWRAAGIDVA